MTNNLIQEIEKYLQLHIIFKIIILVVLLLYVIYSLLLVTQIKELSKVVFIYAKNASRILFVFAIIYFILAVSLFLFALVIL